jgi:hypothetical protein
MSYTPTEWKTGDIVSSQRLNKLEEGVKDAYEFVRIKAVPSESGILAEKNGTEIDAIVAAGNIPVITIGDEEVIGVAYYVGKLGEVKTASFASIAIIEQDNTPAIKLFAVDDDGRIYSLDNKPIG